MVVVFNLRGLCYLAAGFAFWLAAVALGTSMFVGALVGGIAAAAIDIASRARHGCRFAHTRGGMLCLLPVWMIALFGLLAAVMVETALPDDWDRPPSVAPSPLDPQTQPRSNL